MNKETFQIKGEHPPIHPIKNIETAYPNEWIEIEITKMDRNGFTPLEGRLIAHSKDREELNHIAKAYRQKYEVHKTYRNYTGEIEVEAVLL